MKKYIYISLVSAIFLIASAEKFYACSCEFDSEPAKKQIQNSYIGADAVFSGKVVEIKESPMNSRDFIIKFKVAKSWKGESSQEITISTAKESAMCGFNFEIGKIYLVYAFGKSGNFSTTNCTRTANLGKKSDAKYLDKLKRKSKN